MQDPTVRRRIAIGAMVLCAYSSLAIFTITPFAEAIGWLPEGFLLRKGMAAPFGLAAGAFLIALLLARRMPKELLLFLLRPFTSALLLVFSIFSVTQSLGLTSESVWLRHRAYFALLGFSAIGLVVASIAMLQKFSKR